MHASYWQNFKSCIISNVGEDMKGENSYLLINLHWKRISYFLVRLKIHIFYYLASLLLGKNPRETFTHGLEGEIDKGAHCHNVCTFGQEATP